jgi:hypothetical protein
MGRRANEDIGVRRGNHDNIDRFLDGDDCRSSSSQIVTPDDAPLVVMQAAAWLRPYPIGSISSAAQSGVAYFAHIRGFVAGLVLVKFFGAGRAPDAGWG